MMKEGGGMIRVLITLVGAVLIFGVCSADEKPALTDQKGKGGYSLGYEYGESFKKKGVEIDLGVFAAGFWDAVHGKEPRMTPAEMKASLSELQKKMFIAQQLRLREKAAKNLEEGKAFLAENAKKEGVTSLPSGLQYEILSEGAGASPKVGDTVKVRYRGTFIDGTEFDSSKRRGEPSSIEVGTIMPGWTEALQMMKEGSKWKLFVPSELAYGKRGLGRIPPNSTLIFELDLVSVEKPQAPVAKPTAGGPVTGAAAQ
jgi:FKBP-type peptidyl-prolyl cis-trans isomerase FklB